MGLLAPYASCLTPSETCDSPSLKSTWYAQKIMTEEQVQAIEFLAKRCDYGYGTAHARKITDLSTSLFDQLSAIDLLPGMSASERRTLFAASLVHNIGGVGQYGNVTILRR